MAQAEYRKLRGHLNDLTILKKDWLAELRALVKKYREINEHKRAAAIPKYFLDEYPDNQLLVHLDDEIAEIQDAPNYGKWEQATVEADKQAEAAVQLARELTSSVPAS